MFPSSGYFRGVPCPYFVSGLCERPYCHFRHSRVETERSTKTETGPSYSTSSATLYQSSVGSLLKSSEPLSHATASPTDLATGPGVHGAPVEAYETASSNRTGNAQTSTEIHGQNDLGENLSIPSFSSTDPALPESENESPVSLKALPQISGLPKNRKNLPSYVPTPKSFEVGTSKTGTPGYTPTPKGGADDSVRKTGRVVEYDPVRNFKVHDSHKGSDEEEAAFSSDEDNEAIKTADSESVVKDSSSKNKIVEVVKTGASVSTGAEDDLTDSDEDVSKDIPEQTSSKLSKATTCYSELLTPSSFFTEKLTKVSSSSKDKNNLKDRDSAKSLSKQNSTSGDKAIVRPDQEASQEKTIKVKDLQRSNSSKSSSSTSHSKSTSSSSHKSSPALSSSNKEKERSDVKKSSSSSHASTTLSLSSSHSKSGKEKLSSHQTHKSSSPSQSHISSSSSSSQNHKPSSSSSSQNHKPSSSSSSQNHKPSSSSQSKKPSSSSQSHKSSSKVSSSLSSKGSNKSDKPDSTSQRDLSHISKDSKTRQESPSTSRPSLEKPQGSSSEKENKFSSSSHGSSKKSVSRSTSSLSSSSNLSKHEKHKLSQHISQKSVDEKLVNGTSLDKSTQDKKPTVIKSVEDKKPPSLTSADNMKLKHKQHNLKTIEANNVKSDERAKDVKTFSSKSSSSKSRSSLSKTERGWAKREGGPRTSKGGEDQKPSMLSNGVEGDASDSDIEIIEPPPPTVYNISDSDDNNASFTNHNGENSSDSDAEFSFENDIDLLSDSDTHDECLRIFQESEQKMAEKRNKAGDQVHPDKRKAQEDLETFESAENILASVGKKRKAHKNSDKVIRAKKPSVPMKPRLSPAQVMHNRIKEMQKRALLRAARMEEKESELHSLHGGKDKPTSTGITVIGGGLPVAPSSSRTYSNGSGSSSSAPTSTTASASRFGLSPFAQPSTGQKQRQAHLPGKTLLPGNKTPPRQLGLGSASSGNKTPPRQSGTTANTNPQVKGKGPLPMSPNSFYTKKTPPATENPKTIAGTASKTEKRKAHEPTFSNLKRPLIAVDSTSKVPTNVRQRYLNLIIDEHLKFRPELEAFTKGEEDEKAVYEKANNRNIYLGVAVNTIKRIRNEAAQFLPSTSKKPKMNSTPGSLGNHAIQSHAATLGGPNAARQSFTLNRSKTSAVSVPVKVEGKELYNRLKTYIMTEEQLKENGFPRSAEDGSSKVQFYKEEDAGESLKENERVCRRCGTRFNVTKEGDPVSNGLCVYHYGSAYKKRVDGVVDSRYGCCNEKAGTRGCQVAQCHVHERNKKDNRSGYMKTMPASSTSEKNFKVYALDCEMVYTKAGLELARVTVVGEKCDVVYESLVKPDTDIIDYNTRFSGITAADMKGVTTDIRGVQAVMLSMISDKTILMGHSLESDLIALKLIHSTVVDTSLVFPHRLGLPFKRALRNLMLDHLQKIIQANDGGHDSKEDAAAVMELMIYKVKEDVKKEHRRY